MTNKTFHTPIWLSRFLAIMVGVIFFSVGTTHSIINISEFISKKGYNFSFYLSDFIIHILFFILSIVFSKFVFKKARNINKYISYITCMPLFLITFIFFISYIFYYITINSPSTCHEKIESEIISPNKKLKIVEITKNCGAITDYVNYVSIIHSHEDLKNLTEREKPIIFAVNYVNGQIKTEWISNGNIFIHHSPQAEIYVKEYMTKGVSIEYGFLKENR